MDGKDGDGVAVSSVMCVCGSFSVCVRGSVVLHASVNCAWRDNTVL